MNLEIFYALNNLTIKYPALDPVFRFLANDFGLLVVFILGLFLLEHKDKKRGKREATMVVVVAIFAWFLAHFFKDFFGTERPFVVLDNVKNLFPLEDGHAFPSGHATFFSALAMMMYFYHKKIGYALGVVALIVGVSRIIAGVHFPVDILGGYVLGSLISIVVFFFYKNFSRK